MLIALFLLQAASSPPDIELVINAKARSVAIEQKGEAKLEMTAGPDGGSGVRAELTPRAEGSAELRNVEVNIRAEARIADPQQNRPEAETSLPE